MGCGILFPIRSSVWEKGLLLFLLAFILFLLHSFIPAANPLQTVQKLHFLTKACLR